jgi:hypothetical protein
MVKRLVSPERTLYIVHDRDELKLLVQTLELGWQLGGNLRQLCGWEELGSGRINKHLAGNWKLLDDIVWLKPPDNNILVPIVGNISWWQKETPELQGKDLPMSSLKKLVNGTRENVQGWKRWNPTIVQLRAVAHGESLVNRITAIQVGIVPLVRSVCASLCACVWCAHV